MQQWFETEAKVLNPLLVFCNLTVDFALDSAPCITLRSLCLYKRTCGLQCHLVRQSSNHCGYLKNNYWLPERLLIWNLYTILKWCPNGQHFFKFTFCTLTDVRRSLMIIFLPILLYLQRTWSIPEAHMSTANRRTYDLLCGGTHSIITVLEFPAECNSAKYCDWASHATCPVHSLFLKERWSHEDERWGGWNRHGGQSNYRLSKGIP